MILVCRDMLGEEFTVDAKSVRELVPCLEFYVSEALAEPTTAILHYRSSLLPLRGPVPGKNQTAWVMVLGDHGRILGKIPELEAAEAAEVIDEAEATVEKLAELSIAA